MKFLTLSLKIGHFTIFLNFNKNFEVFILDDINFLDNFFQYLINDDNRYECY